MVPLGTLLCKRAVSSQLRHFNTHSLTLNAVQSARQSTTSADFFREALSQKPEDTKKGTKPISKKLKYSERVRNNIRQSLKDASPEAVDSVLSVAGSLKYLHQKTLLKEGIAANDLKRATACIRGIKGSPYKLAKLCNQVRGLSYHEAVAQMQFSKKALGWYVKRVLDSARYNAENTFNLNPDRLLVDNIWAGKGEYLRRMNFHGRGRFGIMHHPHCHVTAILREVPAKDNERRLGRFGRTNKLSRRHMDNNIDRLDFLNQQSTSEAHKE